MTAGVLLLLPELQDTGDVPRGEDPPHVVEVAHVQAAVGAAGQRHRGQQLVSVGQAIAAGAGDAAPPAVAYHAADHWRLLGDEHVLPVAHMKNTWGGHREEMSNTCRVKEFKYMHASWKCLIWAILQTEGDDK